MRTSSCFTPSHGQALRAVLAAALVACGGATFAQSVAPVSADKDLAARVEALAHGWDHVNYEVRGASKADQAAALAAQADAVAHQFPGRAEPLVWKAIALSTEAGAKGGLGALSLAKEAKATLEQARSEEHTSELQSH